LNKIFVFTTTANLFGAEIRVAVMRQASEIDLILRGPFVGYRINLSIDPDGKQRQGKQKHQGEIFTVAILSFTTFLYVFFLSITSSD
jgi:hypothetical protein